MPIGDTGKVRTMTEAQVHKVAESMKTSPWITLSVIAGMLATQGAGIVWGVNRIAETEKKADSANVAATAVQAAVAQVQKNTDLILQVMLNQGKVVVDTVKVPVVVNGADTIAVDTMGHAPR